jgi:diaminopimelate decarboxylase
MLLTESRLISLWPKNKLFLLNTLVRKFMRLKNVDCCLVERLSQKYNTPLYLVDEIELKKRYLDFIHSAVKNYPNSIVAIPYKTNSTPAVLRILHKLGAWAEIASMMEYNIAASLEVSPMNIIFNGPAKTNEELFLVAENAININLDNFDELFRMEKITAKMGKKINVGIRVQVNSSPWGRFGFLIDEKSVINSPAYQAVKYINDSLFLNLVGLHIHAGTSINDLNFFQQISQKLIAFLEEIEDSFLNKLSWINLGGGLDGENLWKNSVRKKDKINLNEYFISIFAPILSYFEKKKIYPLVFLEPGRIVYESTAALLSRVIGYKHGYESFSGLPVAITDVGYHALPSCIGYVHNCSVICRDIEKREEILQQVSGHTCNPHDIIYEKIKLPKLQYGDFILFLGTGAYNMNNTFDFIRPKPKIILWKEDNGFARI